MINSKFNLKSKVVLFTGGYGHLGKEAVLGLASHKAEVYVLGRNREKFSNAFESCGFSNIYFVEFDLEKKDTFRGVFKNIYEKAGRIDVLINNAVYLKGQSPENMTDEEFAFGIDGTLNSLFSCIREIIPFFKEQRAGKIINVSSIYGMVAPDFQIYDESPKYLNPPHYGAAKAGVIQLTKYYASLLGKYNINVNAVSPGPFPSKEVQKTEVFIKELEEHTLLRRIGRPEDLAGAFIFLSSDYSNYITGQNIVVDGGWTVK